MKVAVLIFLKPISSFPLIEKPKYFLNLANKVEFSGWQWCRSWVSFFFLIRVGMKDSDQAENSTYYHLLKNSGIP